MVKSSEYQPSIVNTTFIAKIYHSMTPRFLLTLQMFNKKVHNCLVDSEASSNVIPYAIFQKLNMEPLRTKEKMFNSTIQE